MKLCEYVPDNKHNPYNGMPSVGSNAIPIRRPFLL